MSAPANRSPARWVCIPPFVRYAPDLDDGAVLLYGELTALSDARGYCWATNRYLQDLRGVKAAETIRRWLKQLEAINAIRIVRVSARGMTQRRIYPQEDPPGGVPAYVEQRLRDAGAVMDYDGDGVASVGGGGRIDVGGGSHESDPEVVLANGDREGEDSSPPPSGGERESPRPPRARKTAKAFPEDSRPFKAAAYFFDQLLVRESPHAMTQQRKGRRAATVQEWAGTFDKLTRIDGLSWDEVAGIVKWLFDVDDFWIRTGNLQTANKLRDKGRDGVPRWQTFLTAAKNHYTDLHHGKPAQSPRPRGQYNPGGNAGASFDAVRGNTG